MNTPTTSLILIHGLKIHEVVVGDGIPVLALHGWGAHSGLVTPVAERLAPLGYRIYVPDLPGFGESALPPKAWSVRDYVGFTLAYLDHHRLEQVNLFGHSFGGRLGLVLGAEHASRIGKMALADSAGVRPKGSFGSRARLNAYKFTRDRLADAGMKPLSDKLRAWYSNHYGSADFKQTDGVLRETFVKVVNEDLLPYAARVKVPTLLLWGDEDEDTPLSQGKLLEQTIPDAGLVVFKGAGHYSYLDKLAETVRVVDYFFKQGSS